MAVAKQVIFVFFIPRPQTKHLQKCKFYLNVVIYASGNIFMFNNIICPLGELMQPSNLHIMKKTREVTNFTDQTDFVTYLILNRGRVDITIHHF